MGMEGIIVLYYTKKKDMTATNVIGISKQILQSEKRYDNVLHKKRCDKYKLPDGAIHEECVGCYNFHAGYVIRPEFCVGACLMQEAQS